MPHEQFKTDAPPTGDEEPEGQSEQLAAPASEKVPALQGWHAVTPSPAKPASHAQAALPAVEVECGGHAVHPVTPSPKKPASHRQAALPPVDAELAGHSCLSDVPPGQK